MKIVLKFIKEEMEKMGIDYHFMKNKKSKPIYPYFVGELFQIENAEEDGMQEYSALLTGFDRGNGMEELIEAAEKIEQHFPEVTGLTASVSDSCIAVFHSASNMIESGSEDINKLQVNLTVKLWKGGI